MSISMQPDNMHIFIPARKHITEIKSDPNSFNRSPAFNEIVSFIQALNIAVRGVPISEAPPASDAIIRLLKLLDKIHNWVDDIPAINQPQRYGNKAFKLVHDRLVLEAPNLLNDVVSNENLVSRGVVKELLPYLCASFGDETRIDYGTGHELTFIAFVCCLAKIGIFSSDDMACIVLRVFNRYLNVMRHIQSTYFLEPAGSKGVWGLDDYQFLPFLWGASQLIGHQFIAPKSIHDESILDMNGNDYMYLAAINFVNKMKTGYFSEHSPILNDISAILTWDKVNSGLFKMYRAEVLNKWAVSQHFQFGSLLQFEPLSNTKS